MELTTIQKLEYLFSKINWAKSPLDAKAVKYMNELPNEIREVSEVVSSMSKMIEEFSEMDLTSESSEIAISERMQQVQENGIVDFFSRIMNPSEDDEELTTISKMIGFKETIDKFKGYIVDENFLIECRSLIEAYKTTIDNSWGVETTLRQCKEMINRIDLAIENSEESNNNPVY